MRASTKCFWLGHEWFHVAFVFTSYWECDRCGKRMDEGNL